MNCQNTDSISIKKPKWLKRKLPIGSEYENLRVLLNKSRLNTVCQEAKCPNMWECFSKKTATFLILGNTCTRNCRFCAVVHGKPEYNNPNEPQEVAKAAKNLGLKYIVVTSVTRDDLKDGGASVFAETITQIKEKIKNAKIEVLIPDFCGNIDSFTKVVNAFPDVINHNIETVPSLYPLVRPEADYKRSLQLLSNIKKINKDITTKSGIMLGFGESFDELFKVFEDLLSVGCNILTLGQYLQPSKEHIKVKQFVTPEEFDNLKKVALKMGFDDVASGPLVRSSYNADDLFSNISNN